MSVTLRLADREDLGDAKLLLGAAQGNLQAALIGNETEAAVRNAEQAAEQALITIRRVRERVLG